ncbi:MAG: recombination protein RecR [Clostridia bacterium]|nr:recombination protein RecR [Clostridia bacterium]
MKQPDSIVKLINKFMRLGGVGLKTAQRYAYKVVEMTDEEASEFAEAIYDVKKNVRYCSECGNFSETDVCEICARRDKTVVCVVAQPKDVLAIEKSGAFTGVYHVLHGTISPLEGRTADDIRIKELLSRLGGVEEVIVATNPDVEGEATAMYIARLIKPLGVRVTRPAQGISMGSDIEYADEVTLSRAIETRTTL